MFAPFRRHRTHALLLACAVLLGTMAACGDREGSPGSGGGDAELVKALGRLADTENIRTNVRFADEAVTMHFPRKTGSVKWRGLIGRGSARLQPEVIRLPDYDIRLDNSEYVVTAGGSSRDVSLVAGGQFPVEVTRKLVAAGWRDDGGGLVAPPVLTGDGLQFLSIAMPRVHGEGGDLFVGGDDANWDDVRAAPERSLAANPTFRALAGCLGDVVAAYFRTRTRDERTYVIAAGVLRAGAGSSKPAKFVVCSSWSTAEDMDRSVTEQRQEYAHDRPAEVFRDVTVTALGGGLHMVRATAGTAEPDAILAMVDDGNAPGMQYG
ncbi:hypothetical protein ACQEVZ_08075 [Dactylosporangium sp. CA-152071]|uniref:hypothetical protein n=1 Tax=Dactylosporangium sp. CA-152071 TaxID=3239933 RepID=UPI003D8BE164